MSERNIFQKLGEILKKPRIEGTQPIYEEYPVNIPWRITNSTYPVITEFITRRINGVDILVRPGTFIDFNVPYPFNVDQKKANERLVMAKAQMPKISYGELRRQLMIQDNKN